MELSLQTDTVADRTVVHVGGEIDAYTVPRLRQLLLGLVEEGAPHLVVDLSRVEFLDSSGLGVLAGVRTRMRERRGSLVLVCAQERILKIFRIIGLDGVFTIVPSVAEAVAVGGSDGDAADGGAADGGAANGDAERTDR